MLIDYQTKKIQIKIVYYGCAMSGKTTALKNIFQEYNNKDQLVSIETSTGRTLFFDFGTLQVKGGDWTISIHLYSATGQDFYASTRPATLIGADGIIFMIDSQKQYFDENLRSWRELEHYYDKNLLKMPIMFCFNKRDLEDLIEKEDFSDKIDLKNFHKIDFFYTIAKEGKGVIEAFKKILSYIFPAVVVK